MERKYSFKVLRNLLHNKFENPAIGRVFLYLKSQYIYSLNL